MPTVPVADATLYYQEQGAGDPLMLAHGHTGVGERWAAVATALADRHRVIVPDLRGHGRTTGAPETMGFDRSAADLVALLDQLGLERAHFVGHSGGGQAVLLLGLRALPRARTLTLVGTPHAWDAPVRARLCALPDRWLAQPGWIDEQRGRHDATHGADHWRVLLATLRAWADDPAVPPYRPADLVAITCPTLVVHGDRDWVYPLPIAARSGTPRLGPDTMTEWAETNAVNGTHSARMVHPGAKVSEAPVRPQAGNQPSAHGIRGGYHPDHARSA